MLNTHKREKKTQTTKHWWWSASIFTYCKWNRATVPYHNSLLNGLLSVLTSHYTVGELWMPDNTLLPAAIARTWRHKQLESGGCCRTFNPIFEFKNIITWAFPARKAEHRCQVIDIATDLEELFLWPYCPFNKNNGTLTFFSFFEPQP